MTARAEQGRERLVLVYPSLMLGLFFAAPFAIMLATSFYHRVEGGLYAPGFELTHYRRFLSAFFLEHLGFSLFVAALAGVICVAIAFPFSFWLTRLGRRSQVVWLVLLLSVLSLSEVIVGFSWSVLLSRTAGLSNLLVFAGLLDRPVAWSPGFVAMMLGLVYLACPYAVLMLYPQLSRLDPELAEAARTMGASPLRTFFTVVVPVLRPAIVATLIMVFVFTLGAYLIPQLLGRPQHWTLSVLITDQAIFQSNVPFASAMAIFLMLVSLALIGAVGYLGRGRAGGR